MTAERHRLDMARPPGIAGSRRRLAAAALTLLVVLTVAAPAFASPQPDAACDVCGVNYEQGAADAGINVTVTHSTAEVRIHENGTATWVVRNRLTPESIDRLSDDSVSLDVIARASFDTYPGGPVEEPSSLATSRTDRTVTVRYRDGVPVSRTAGATVLEYFDTNGYDYWYVVNADRLTVVSPEGTRVTNQPAGASVDGRTVTWRGTSDDAWGGPDITGDARVVYVDSGASAPGLRTTAALWADTLPIYLDNLRSYLFPTLLAAGVLSLAGLGLARRVGTRPRARGIGRGLWALGVVGAVGAVGVGLVTGALENAGWWVAVAGLLATVGWLATEHPERFETPRRAVLTGLAGALVGTLAATPLVVLAGSPGGATTLPAVGRLLLLQAPLALAPAAGLFAGRSDRQWVLAGWGTLVGAFAVAAMAIIPVADRPFGIILLVLVGGAVVGSLVTTPLATLGAGFARE